MNDAVIEKLTQKVVNMTEEVNDVNILVRRLTPAQETLNRINERIDAVYLGMVQIEKALQLNEKRFLLLEGNGKSMEFTLDAVRESLDLVKQSLEDQKKSMDSMKLCFNSLPDLQHTVKDAIDGQKNSMSGVTEIFNKINEKFALLTRRIDQIDSMALIRSEDWKKQLEEEKQKFKLTEIVIAVLFFIIVSVLVLRH